MMEKMRELVSRYNQAYEELMDAHKYAKLARAADQEDKNMYVTLGKQEMVHSELLTKSGDKVAESDESLRHAWQEMKGNLSDWRDDLMQKFSNIERQK